MAQRLSRLVLANRYDELSRLSTWAGEITTGLGLAPRDAFRIDLALTEAVTNSLMHGGMAEGLQGAVTLEAIVEGGRLEVIIEDHATPFDPTTAETKRPATHLDSATPGGAGILLLRAYCDEIRHTTLGSGNRLQLSFNLQGAA